MLELIGLAVIHTIVAFIHWFPVDVLTLDDILCSQIQNMLLRSQVSELCHKLRKINVAVL